MASSRTRIEVHSDEEESLSVLRRDARNGLSSRPRFLHPKYFYDDRGSKLFDEITELPEYYLTRAELSILHERADEIAKANRAAVLVELGPGSSLKSCILLDAMSRAGTLDQYVPVEIGIDALERLVKELSQAFPRLFIHAIAGDFARALKEVPPKRPRLVALLGSTIGNMEHREAVRLLGQISELIQPGDLFLLGTDLVKDVAVLEAAYNDSAGVTARFNKNILSVMNDRLGADFDPDLFDHEARFNREASRVEIRLRARKDHTVRIPDLQMKIPFRAGEIIHTENSHKYTRQEVTSILAEAGLRLQHWFLDHDKAFALSLSGRPA